MKRASRGLREVECLGHRGGFGRSSLIWACQARRDDIKERASTQEARAAGMIRRWALHKSSITRYRSRLSQQPHDRIAPDFPVTRCPSGGTAWKSGGHRKTLSFLGLTSPLQITQARYPTWLLCHN